MTCQLKFVILFMYVADNPKKTEHLLSLEGAKERLHLFKADLLEEGAFDALVEGCECVFHTASPLVVSATDPQVNTYHVNSIWKFSIHGQSHFSP